MTKKSKHNSSKAKQTVLDVTSPAKRTVFGNVKLVESNHSLALKCIEFGKQHKGCKYKALHQRKSSAS